MNLNRRSILILTASSLASASFFVQSQDLNTDEVHEFQRGDPNGPREYVSFSASKVASNVKETKADYLPKLKDFGELLIDEATKYVGFNRENNRDTISEFLEVFKLGFTDSKGKPYAFCAAGIGYVAAKIYAKTRNSSASYSDVIQSLGDIDHYHFFPTPGVRNMVTVAQVHGRWIPTADVANGKVKPQPGWLAVFKWNKTDHHIGILRCISEGKLKTVEFNTSPEGAQGSQANGGAIAERNRNLDQFVLGFINTGVQIST